MTAQQQRWIDQASYADLIAKVRNEPADSVWFDDDYIFRALRLKTSALVKRDEEMYGHFQLPVQLVA